MTRIGFHTQEDRGYILSVPCKCVRDDAWLGEGYYFWIEENDAILWGENSKAKRNGKYQIYKAIIVCDNILDTVFNEEQYLFWIKTIERAAKSLIKNSSYKPTLKEVNKFLKEKAGWGKKITGIMFQDLPTNENYLLIRPTEDKGKRDFFAYKKRIQIGIFDLGIISEFTITN